MKTRLLFLSIFFFANSTMYAGKWDFLRDPGSGDFSLGTRNAFSIFNDMHGESPGVGIGGQFRLQFSDKINTEWFLDYLNSDIGKLGKRNDYHVGWSIMYYLGKSSGFDNFIKPYFIAGHCFDYTEVFAKENREVKKDRLSMATQAGLGTHFNITRQLDCSISTQYMLHFGKEIEAYEQEGKFIIQNEKYSKAGGHLLAVLSINYKIAKLW